MSNYHWGPYQFEVHSRYNEDWTDTGGVYIFAEPIPGVFDALLYPDRVTWKARYVGKTKSFSERLHDDHDKWMDAVDLGFTHVHILPVGDKNERKRVEKQLIRKYQPILNVQGK